MVQICPKSYLEVASVPMCTALNYGLASNLTTCYILDRVSSRADSTSPRFVCQFVFGPWLNNFAILLHRAVEPLIFVRWILDSLSSFLSRQVHAQLEPGSMVTLECCSVSLFNSRRIRATPQNVFLQY